jgi:hypothetical protein
MKKTFAICIPIYREEPDEIEKFSLNKLKEKTSQKWPMVFIAPQSMDVKNYLCILDKATVSRFDDSYFESTKTYSKLCESHELYEIFKDYDYMYIYQTDCYLLTDQLQYWVDNFNYDYIGGPIVAGNSGWRTVPFVGNGGFSLRKVSTFLYITDEEFLAKHKAEIDKANEEENGDYNTYEDLYFAQLIPDIWPDFSKASVGVAAKFAWDRNQDAMFNKYKKLPMCLHGYDRFAGLFKSIFNYPDEVVQCAAKKYNNVTEYTTTSTVPNGTIVN